MNLPYTKRESQLNSDRDSLIATSVEVARNSIPQFLVVDKKI